jgi:hypothetical protein
LVAAGSGSRLGASVPKAFVPVAGRPMIEWSVDALRAAGIEEIIVALPEGEEAARRALAKFAKLDKSSGLLGRGIVRFDLRDPKQMVVRLPKVPDPAAAPAVVEG